MTFTQLISLISSSKDPNLIMWLSAYMNSQGNTETEENAEEEDSTEMCCVCWKLVVKVVLFLLMLMKTVVS